MNTVNITQIINYVQLITFRISLVELLHTTWQGWDERNRLCIILAEMGRKLHNMIPTCKKQMLNSWKVNYKYRALAYLFQTRQMFLKCKLRALSCLRSRCRSPCALNLKSVDGCYPWLIYILYLHIFLHTCALYYVHEIAFTYRYSIHPGMDLKILKIV